MLYYSWICLSCFALSLIRRNMIIPFIKKEKTFTVYEYIYKNSFLKNVRTYELVLFSYSRNRAHTHLTSKIKLTVQFSFHVLIKLNQRRLFVR